MFSPTATTTPAPSWPAMPFVLSCIATPKSAHSSWMRDLSEAQRPVQLILTRISWGLGESTSTCWMGAEADSPEPCLTATSCILGIETDAMVWEWEGGNVLFAMKREVFQVRKIWINTWSRRRYAKALTQ